MSTIQKLRHDTGITISLKTETRPVITRIGNTMLIQVGVSPIAATPVKDAAVVTKVA
jgi:hypothetical protein